jgi:hypothetical protein
MVGRSTKGWNVNDRLLRDKLLRYGAAVVLANALVNLPHGAAHAGEGASLPALANAFVAIVIVIAPFVALGLLRAGRLRAGAWLLFTSMLGALLFGIVYHFVLPGLDNVAYVPAGPWQLPFQATAMLLVLVEAAGVGVGGWMLSTLGRSTPKSGHEA